MSERYELHHGDCLDILRTLPDNSIDAVVTDPPYGLAFMGKRWDYDVPSEDIWRECLRVLKPGGHLLAFAGTRTQHRMAVRIEDAGFEIRDMIAWVYGSGFPKSLDVSKAIDKAGGNRAGFAEFRDAVKDAMKRNNVSRKSLESALGNYMLSHYLTAGSQPAVPNYRDYVIIRDHVGMGDTFDNLFAPEAEREVVGKSDELLGRKSGIGNGTKGHTTVGGTRAEAYNITAPATDAAKQWQGWGTALKPALEPITVARKPLIGTVAENVLTWGTGGVNVDGCRVGVEASDPNQRSPKWYDSSRYDKSSNCYGKGLGGKQGQTNLSTLGRWPANLIHDGSEEAVFGMGESSRYFYCAKASKRDRDEGLEAFSLGNNMRVNAPRDSEEAKHATLRANNHPTVKPTDLMRYLCRLVTQPDGVVLDPFMGSGSTGKGAILEGFRFVGIEREAEYIDIARARIQHAVDSLPNTLFDNTGE